MLFLGEEELFKTLKNRFPEIDKKQIILNDYDINVRKNFEKLDIKTDDNIQITIINKDNRTLVMQLRDIKL